MKNDQLLTHQKCLGNLDTWTTFGARLSANTFMQFPMLSKMRRSAQLHPRLLLPILGVALCIGLALRINAQATSPAPPPAGAANTVVNSTSPEQSSQERLALLEREIANEKRRLDDIFNIFLGLGGLATLLFGFLSWHRESKQQQNYRRERDFYEEHAGRQARADDKMVTEQIASISELGKVISLVREASQIHLDREERQEELEQLIKSIKDDAEERYQEAEKDSLRFSEVGAMRWPSLPEERRRIASGACRLFGQVQKFVLTEKRQKSPITHARLLHFMGIFAYYADHNVDASLTYLTDANTLFGEIVPNDYCQNQAYTKHFLGVLEKNWPLRNEPLGTSLKEAQKHLQAAENYLTMESGQFLTALTHAEVLSYRDEDRVAAVDKLNEIIIRIEGFKTTGQSNISRDELLPRAYLLRGNVSYMKGEIDQASADFLRAKELSQKNPYPLLSLALTKTSSAETLELWERGLSFLPRPPALEKPETLSRVLIFAWGMIAAHHSRLPELLQEYKTAFDSIGHGIEKNGKYTPRFFSPISKQLTDFDGLQDQIDDHFKNAPVLP